MFQILVADDEPLTREFLANNISALCSDFQVTGVACDGMEAIALCKKQHFDLIITDIRMPEMDGLGLCKFVYESQMDCHLVILSGYNEFEYARTALRYQVSDYILKPINDDHLKELLFNIREDLIKKQTQNNCLEDSSLKAKSNYELHCELLQHLMNEKEDGIYATFSLLEDRNAFFLQTSSCMVRIALDEFRLIFVQEKHYDRTTHHLKLFKICQDYCRQHKFPFFYDRQNAVQILLQGTSEEIISQNILSCFSELKVLCEASALPALIMTCGNFFVDILDTQASGMIATRAFALTLKGKKNLITYEEYLSDLPFLEEVVTVCEAMYLTYLKSDSERMKKHLLTYIALFPTRNHAGYVLGIGSFLIRHICERCNMKTHYMQTAYQSLMEQINQMILTYDFSDEKIFAALTQSMMQLMKSGKTIKSSEGNQLADAAKQYIYAHFNEALSLSSLADTLNVNSCYLSDLIHKNLGESYSKVVLRVRMERAVEIMRTNPNEKIYIIATKVGFVSPKHFIAVFKKYYGLTPTAYAEQKFKS